MEASFPANKPPPAAINLDDRPWRYDDWLDSDIEKGALYLLLRRQLRSHHRDGKTSAPGVTAKLLWVMMAFSCSSSASLMIQLFQFTRQR